MTFIVVKLRKVTSRFMNIMYNARKNKKRQSKQIMVLFKDLVGLLKFLISYFENKIDLCKFLT